MSQTSPETESALAAAERSLLSVYYSGRLNGDRVIKATFEQLRAALAKPGLAQTTKVRPLVWEETFTDRGDGSQDQTGWEADSGFGSWYDISQYFGSDSYGWQVQYNCEVIADRDDPDQAKADAQAHFEKSVLAALTDSSTSRDSE